MKIHMRTNKSCFPCDDPDEIRFQAEETGVGNDYSVYGKTGINDGNNRGSCKAEMH